MKVHGLSMTNASAKPQEYRGKGEKKKKERGKTRVKFLFPSPAGKECMR
jgi:hypothetical protein